MPGNHHRNGRAIERLHLFEHLQAVHLLQPDVQQKQVKRASLNPFETLLARCHGFDVVSFVAQQRAERFADAAFVVNDEYGGWHFI